MQPLIVDPATYDKTTAFAAGVDYVNAFLALNGIDAIDEILTVADDTKKPPGANPWHQRGWYWFGTLFVNLKKSRVPVKNPGFSWSFTGFKADLTAPGVLAHETGHHTHFWLNTKHSPEELLRLIRAVRAEEPAVSGYEPNNYEVFAEAMRLFILNPTLLQAGRPKRYQLLTHVLGLRPLHSTPWRQVLQFAHPRLIAAAESWINR